MEHGGWWPGSLDVPNRACIEARSVQVIQVQATSPDSISSPELMFAARVWMGTAQPAEEVSSKLPSKGRSLQRREDQRREVESEHIAQHTLIVGWAHSSTGVTM